MKKQFLTLVVGLLFLTINAAVAQDGFLQKYSKMKGVEYIEIPFGMLSGSIDIGADYLGDGLDAITQNASGMTILVVDEKNMFGSVQKDIDAELKDSKYKTVMNINSDGTFVKMFMVESHRKDSSAFVLYVQEDDELVFMSIQGEFDMEDASKLLNNSK